MPNYSTQLCHNFAFILSFIEETLILNDCLFFPVCMSMHIWMRVHIASICAYSWRDEENLRCPSLGITHPAFWDSVSSLGLKDKSSTINQERSGMCLTPAPQLRISTAHPYTNIFYVGSKEQTQVIMISTLATQLSTHPKYIFY